MPLLALLISGTFIAGLVFRVIAALGFTVVSFVGLDLALDSLNSQMNTYLSDMPLTAKALLDMAGITTIVFWLTQAYAARVALSAARTFFTRTSRMS